MAHLEFNLLPEEFRRPEREIRLRLWGVVLAGVAVVLIVFLILIYTGQMRRLDELVGRINHTQSEIEKLQESVRLTEEVDRLKSGLAENIDAINALANQNALRVTLLQEVNRCIPPHLALVSLEERSQTYLMTGYAASNLIIATFIDKLKQSKRFTTVALTYIRPTTIGGEDVLSFEISAVAGYYTPPATQQQ